MVANVMVIELVQSPLCMSTMRNDGERGGTPRFQSNPFTSELLTHLRTKRHVTFDILIITITSNFCATAPWRRR
jgi:hypothetical protein